MKKPRKPGRVPPLPPEYAGGLMPPLPPGRGYLGADNDTSCIDGGGWMHVGPAAVNVHAAQPPRPGPKTEVIEGREVFVSPAVEEIAQQATALRLELADMATAEILGEIEGQEMTADLCHMIRWRVQKLAELVDFAARSMAARMQHVEHGAARKMVDPAEAVRRVDARVARGMTKADAFLEVADELGASDNTIRNTYQAHKKRRPK